MKRGRPRTLPLPPSHVAQDPYANYVYFVEDPESGLIKIGCTYGMRLMERVREFERAAGYPMRLLAAIVGDRKVERAYHDRFQATRDHGEWFRPSDELNATVTALALQPRIDPLYAAYAYGCESFA